MELIYEIKPPQTQLEEKDAVVDFELYDALSPVTAEENTAQTQPPISALSIRNLFAFTTTLDLSSNNKVARDSKRYFGADSTSSVFGGGLIASGGAKETFESGVKHPQIFYVFVIDLNTPWEINLVKESPTPISHLKWEPAGEQILIGSSEGHLELYGMVDNILNQWKLLFRAEHKLSGAILNSAWLPPPQRILINTEKDSQLYNEKYNTVFTPPKSMGFGGKSLEGLVAFTSSNRMISLIVNTLKDPPKAITITQKVGEDEESIKYADFAYSDDGQITLLTSNGDPKSPLNMYKVTVVFDLFRNNGEIKLELSDSLSIPTSDLPENSTINHVHFTNQMSPGSVLVSLSVPAKKIKVEFDEEMETDAVGGEVGSSLLLFELVGEEKKWQVAHQIHLPSIIDCIGSASLPFFDESLPSASSYIEKHPIFQPGIAVSCKDGTVFHLRADNLQQVGPQIKKEDSGIGPEAKRIKLTSTNGFNSCTRYSTLNFCWGGSLLLGMEWDSPNLGLYKLANNIESGTLSTLLEMTLIGGIDPWPITTVVKQGQVDQILEKLNENYAKQPPECQSYYNIKMLALKFLLSQHQTPSTCSNSSSAHDPQIILTLHLIYGALKALLRPCDLSSNDKGPAESLSSILQGNKGEPGSNNTVESDVDKILLLLDAKKYAVDSSSLQSLQQFFQWIADLILKLLSTLPDIRHPRAPLYELSRDVKALGILRELIVLMRIWGLISKTCQPIFRKTSDNLDVLSLLFRLLTRLFVTAPDPDESLIDECCLLSSELQIPSITYLCNYYYNNYDVHSLLNSLGEAKSIKNFSIQFEFGYEKPVNRPFPAPTPISSSSFHHNGVGNFFSKKRRAIWIDTLRLIWLGRNPAGLKICNRCGSTTLIHMPTRCSANRAWDNRSVVCCPCGGSWKILFPNQTGNFNAKAPGNEPDTHFLNNL